MELKIYIKIVQRWAWVLILFSVLGAGSGYLASRLLKPTYQAMSEILVNQNPLDTSSEFANMNSQQLLQTYLELLTTTNLIDEVSLRLNFAVDAKNDVQVQQIPNTQIIQIITENGNAQRAADIANTLVNVLVERSASTDRYIATEENLKLRIAQIDDEISTLQVQYNQIVNNEVQIVNNEVQSQLKQVNEQITGLQDEILSLQKEIAGVAPSFVFNAEKSVLLAEKQARLSQIQPLLTQYQQIRANLEYAGKPSVNLAQSGDLRLQEIQLMLDFDHKRRMNLLDSIESVKSLRLQKTPTIVQIEKASSPAKPIRPIPLLYTMLAATIGLALSFGVALLVEYLDTTLKTPQDIQQALGIPVLEHIAEMRATDKSTQGWPLAKRLHSSAADAFDSLRINLEFIGQEKPLKTILVVDAGQGEERTIVAANLAISFAQAGRQVALVDANLRQPRLHDYLEVENLAGLSDVLTSNLDVQTICISSDQFKGMTLVLGGTPCANPLPLLESEKMSEILLLLQKKMDAVILVGPPVSVADMLALASKADGVLQVIRTKRVGVGDARAALVTLERAQARIAGAVMVAFDAKRLIPRPKKKTVAGAQVKNEIMQNDLVSKK